MTSPIDGRLARPRLVSAPGRLARPGLRLCLCACLGLTVAAAACDTHAERPLSTRSKVKVKLPPTPDLTPKDVQIKHSDGTFTVAGVLSKRAELVGRAITVRGRVLSVSGCPAPPAPADADAADAPPPVREDCYPPPHLYIGDAADAAERRLLVTGPMSAGVADQVVGRVVTLQGDFDLVSPDGAYIRQAGLLVLPAPAPREPEGPAADAAP